MQCNDGWLGCTVSVREIIFRLLDYPANGRINDGTANWKGVKWLGANHEQVWQSFRCGNEILTKLNAVMKIGKLILLFLIRIWIYIN